ncbi:glycosyltransferase family 2 protein [Neorhizobium alkalisoli]|nr:glycosyltransferase family 2 protein [Neorhizobium alkalisoli]
MSDTRQLGHHEILQAAKHAADQRDWEVAAGFFAQAITFDPSAALIVQYGHMLKEAGYLEAAVGAYRAALLWDGTATDGYVHLGHLLKRLSRPDEAIETFKAARRIPYGPHVEPEISGLNVARLNASHVVRSETGDNLRPMSESVRHRDEVLHAWLAAQNDARLKDAERVSKSAKAAFTWRTKRIPSTLEPAADLVVERGIYRATTNRSRMRLQPISRTGIQELCGQWIEITLKISETECVVDPILYIEETPGWGRFRAVRLVKQSGNTYGVIIRMPPSVVSLRLDPVHTPGKLIVSDLNVLRLSWFSVLMRVFAKASGPSIANVLKAGLRGSLASALDRHFATKMADEYGRWIAFNEGPALAVPMPSVDEGTVGFVTMISGGEGEQFAAILASLRTQSSSRWRLAVVLDESLESSLRAAIEREASRDERVKVAVVKPSTSRATRMSSGMVLLDTDLIGQLPPGDILANGAVANFLEYSKANPAAVVIYCDHDEIDESGRRHSPRFKPDWNADYILCYDYVGPSVLFSRAAIDAAGGWRDDFPELETFDLLLRISENVGSGRIGHFAKPVWHCGLTGESTPIVALVNERLVRRKPAMSADLGMVPGTVKLRWPMPANPPHVTIIIPTRDRLELVRTAIDSILSRTEYPSFDIILVDNGSVEQQSLDYFKTISRDERISVLRDDGPFNFSRLNNRAADIAKGAVLALVNNDVEVMDGSWLREMVSIAIDPNIGAVGAKLLYGSGHLQHAGIVGGVGTVAGHGHKYELAESTGYMNRLLVQQTVVAVTGACLVVEASKYKAVGGLNEEHLTVAFNDVDLCLKLGDRGWRSVFTPWATLYHHESLSRGLDLSGERAARFEQEADFMVKEWGSKILQDRFYNPNLTLEHEDFSFRYPMP